MANNRQVMDIHASAGITVDQSKEHQRKWSDKGWDDAAKHGNYDPTRAHLNFEIARGGVVQSIDTSKSIPQRIRESLKARGIEDPNEILKAKGQTPNRRTVVNIIFGGSRDRMNELAFGDQVVDFERGADNSHIKRRPEIEQWAQDVYRFACDKWGEDNIAGFYVHLDELNCHVHCTLLPITAKNKFSFKEVFAGKDKAEFTIRMRALHDELSVVNEKWGLARGQNINETGSRHRTTEEYRRQLRQECDAMESRITEGHATLESLLSDIRLAERRCKGLSTMIENLVVRKTQISAEIEALNKQLKDGNGDAEKLSRQIEKLQRQLASTDASLADKREKLQTADRMLALLKEEQGEIEEANKLLTQEHDQLVRQNAILQDRRTELTSDTSRQMNMRMTDAVFGFISAELRKLSEHLTPEQKSKFDSDFLLHLAEAPGEIVKCAVYLFMGYVDGAIQFAQGSGGGGGSSSSLKWGRDPDEDDRRFAFRCMVQAHKLLRPAQSSRRKR